MITGKKTSREEDEAMVVGVVAGLARYFKQDPTLFRVVTIFFLVVTGFFPVLLLYMGAAYVMPKRGKYADYTIDE
jgi:phage shock protein C